MIPAQHRALKPQSSGSSISALMSTHCSEIILEGLPAATSGATARLPSPLALGGSDRPSSGAAFAEAGAALPGGGALG
jgi:hypothetical protein